jgi:hypothetical protein
MYVADEGGVIAGEDDVLMDGFLLPLGFTGIPPAKRPPPPPPPDS